MTKLVIVRELPPLHDIKNSSCPKCGAGAFNHKTKYCESTFHADGEHLHVACGNCAFERYAQCIDYKSKEVVESLDIVEDVRVRAAAAESYARSGDDVKDNETITAAEPPI